ncbi:Single domain von Willebrand factor type C [Popillia japonica]|uniref:Single domain von Willebrand factor type C n=1 Tax=Popillia japonica TaxID=7064 RepID=A0AAW1IA50_POPJA
MINFLYTSLWLHVTCFPLVFCATSIEDAPVYRAKDRARGYACESAYDAIGLMKEGEVKKNYEEALCGEARCSDGVIEYFGCDITEVGPRCVVADKDFSKPYPDCCGQVTCF